MNCQPGVRSRLFLFGDAGVVECRAYGTRLSFARVPTAAAVNYRVPPANGGLVWIDKIWAWSCLHQPGGKRCHHLADAWVTKLQSAEGGWHSVAHGGSRGAGWGLSECRRHGTFPDSGTETCFRNEYPVQTLPCAMPHAYSQNLIHLVFSTKDRRDLIPPQLQPRLWRYLAGIALNHAMYPKAIGGIANHVHILFDLPSTISLSEVTQVLKSNSSRWMREHDRAFAWQRGYGGFGVSESNRVAVERYIARQEEHHRKISFEQEFEELLKRHNIQYDPRWMLG